MDIETLALAKGYTNKQIKKLSINGIKGDKGDPGKDAVIDTTLSNSGEAADAKVVGNEISSLKEDLVIEKQVIWEQGTINSTTGIESNSNVRIRSGFIEIRNVIRITFDTLKIMCICYDGETVLGSPLYTLAKGQIIIKDDILSVFPKTDKIRLIAYKSNVADILPDDGVSVKIVEYKPTKDIYDLIDKNNQEMTEKVNNAISHVVENTTSEWEIGSINSTTGIETDNAKRTRSGLISFASVESVTCNITKFMIFFYTKTKSYIGCYSGDYIARGTVVTRENMLSKSSDIAYVRLILLGEYETVTIDDVEINSLTSANRVISKIEQLENESNMKYRFDHKFMKIAYSTINIAPINTKEHFMYCAKTGKFDALKCDVRVTSDNKLILCHDSGFTLDSNGKITSFDSDNNVDIYTLTYSDCIALEYANQYNGEYCHPCGLDDFLIICKRFGLVPYITVRGEKGESDHADLVNPLVVDALHRFELERNCIVNSFSVDSLLAIRNLEPLIYLSQVVTPYNNSLVNEALENAIRNENYMLNAFYNDGTNNYDSMMASSIAMHMIDSCQKNSIRLFGSQTTSDDDIDKIISLGFGGTQCKVVLEY